MTLVSDDRLIRGPEADAICGISRSRRYELIQQGKFPRPVKLGFATRFSYRECQAWVQARLTERDDASDKGGTQ